MSAKIFRFPLQSSSECKAIAAIAPEEVGYGITLSLLKLMQPRLTQFVRSALPRNKPDFANSSLMK